MPERRERHFAGKVHAFNAGYERVKDQQYGVMAISMRTYRSMMKILCFPHGQVRREPNAWSRSTPYRQGTSTHDYRFVNIQDVAGACQLFRRECFEEIGGYLPVKGGGVDHIGIPHRENEGWKTRTFTEKVCLHHRPAGTAQHSP